MKITYFEPLKEIAKCHFCGEMKAKIRVTHEENGEHDELEICDECYDELVLNNKIG